MSDNNTWWTPPSGGSGQPSSTPQPPQGEEQNTQAQSESAQQPQQSQQPQHQATTEHAWVPPSPPRSSNEYGDVWNTPAEPVVKKPSNAVNRLFGVLAIAIISAIVGGGVGAAVVSVNDNDVPSEISTKSTVPVQAISAPATPQSIRSVLDRVQPAVVSVSVESPQKGSGTGMIISPDGHVLTNAHVVRGATSIKVTLNGEKTSISAKLLGLDPSLDSAVIKIDPPAGGLVVADLGDSDQILVGDQVVAIGNALALAGGPSVTTGIVSAKDREISDGTQTLSNLLQTDAAINPGNSGGPLVNMAGQVIGMNTAVIRGQEGEFQNIGFAMAVNAIKPIIGDLQTGKIRQQALLGVQAVTLTEDIRERYDFTPEQGAVIDTVTRNGPADKAGLSRFDVIVEIDGKAITTSEQLTSQIRAHAPDDKVKVTYYRGDERREVEVTLGARPV